MKDVVIVGGGWAGCSAAVSAAKAGARVLLLERTDMLLGTGLVGGIMRNNGRYTAAEELTAMGAGELFEACDRHSRHRNIEFPGHSHASLYDVTEITGAVEEVLDRLGVSVVKRCRVNKVRAASGAIKAVASQDGQAFEGKVFVDATGTAGPMNNCIKYGNGCAMCILRCPTFGGRESLAALCGVQETKGKRPDGNLGAMSGSCKLLKDSLSRDIRGRLDNDGAAVIPIPSELRKTDLSSKACQQYALNEYAENIILLDTGHAKMMSPYFNLDSLKMIPGFENARYEDPYAGGIGNSMRYFAISPRDNSLKVKGVRNLFCAGEKCGSIVGHTEAICTGALAGHNAVRYIAKEDLLKIPDRLAVGDIIAYVQEQMRSEQGLTRKYTFSGSVYFERMKEKGLYTIDKAQIEEKVKKVGMKDIFNMRLIEG